jgi:putative membrane protein
MKIGNVKLAVSMLLIGLIVLFIAQNTAVVEIRLLFWKVSMSRSLLIFSVLLIGIIAGWLLRSYVMHRKTGNP